MFKRSELEWVDLMSVGQVASKPRESVFGNAKIL